MLPHFVIEYIQSQTYQKFRYFWRNKSNLRGHQLLGYYNICTVHQDVTFPLQVQLFGYAHCMRIAGLP